MIAVIDYGVGNLFSLSSSLAYLGLENKITRSAREVPGLGVTASGGISSLSEIRALAAMGTKAAIVGKAVYTGALALPDVLAAAGEE